MQVTATTYRRLAQLVGSLLTLVGVSLTALFLAFVWTGNSPLARATPAIDGIGLLILASVGAFALPLGLSLFSADAATTTRLRIAGSALGLMALLRLAAFVDADLRAIVGTTPLVEAIVLGLVALVACGVRRETESPIEIPMQVEIDAPASEAWKVLAVQFADVAEYASSLRSSSVEGPVGAGAVRTCETVPFGPFSAAVLTETLTDFDPEAMHFAYVAGGDLPPMIPSSKNRWSVEALGPRRCRVSCHASVDLRWWALPLAKPLGWSIRSAVLRFGEELRHRVESGEPHPRKRASLARR